MDIPALSMAMSQIDTSNQVQVALMAKTLDSAKEQGASMIKMMERSVNPHIGGNIDISV